MNLRKGMHAPVPTSLLTVAICWQSSHTVDAHGLLLDPSGKVRTDHDFVFYNAPRHRSQAVTLDQDPAPGTARLSVSLPRTEPDIDRIMLTGSVEHGNFAAVTGLTLTILGAQGPLVIVAATDLEPVNVLKFGEFYRSQTGWEFRALNQGWPQGMAALITECGVQIGDEVAGRTGSPATESAAAAHNYGGGATTLTLRRVEVPERVEEPAAPPHPERADWHIDPHDPNRLRWWDGTRWTGATRTIRRAHPGNCDRCGRQLARRLFRGFHPCGVCDQEIAEFLTHWHNQAWRILNTVGPQGPEWTDLWASLRYQRIEETAGRAALRELAHDHVERMVAFAFADGIITATEYERFDHAVTELSLSGPLIDDLYRRMRRCLTLSQLRGGELPALPTPDLHLEAEEIVHLDTPASRVRALAKGTQKTPGRLIASSKKLRFVGNRSGLELTWSRIVSVTADHTGVTVSATSSRGGGTFLVDDPEYVAAALEGALRVAKRLRLIPQQRDTRSISQDVKAQVWQRDGGQCVECGESHYLEFDHIIPLSRGGATSVTNLQILCRGCNRAKGARI